LKPDGLLAFHLTNRYVDLPPPVAKTAAKIGLNSILLTVPRHNWTYLVVSRQPAELESFKKFVAEHSDDYPDLEVSDVDDKAGINAWTDDFANIFSVLQ
jgi:hypothetical protein